MRLDRAPGKVLCQDRRSVGCGMGITVTDALVVMGRTSLCSRVDRAGEPAAAAQVPLPQVVFQFLPDVSVFMEGLEFFLFQPAALEVDVFREREFVVRQNKGLADLALGDQSRMVLRIDQDVHGTAAAPPVPSPIRMTAAQKNGNTQGNGGNQDERAAVCRRRPPRRQTGPTNTAKATRMRPSRKDGVVKK